MNIFIYQVMKLQKLQREVYNRQHQAKVCNKICQRIAQKDYHDASILIRYYLNDKSFNWYKPIERIIENQITNLFYDVTYHKTSCYEFFNRQYKELQEEIFYYTAQIEKITGGN